MAFSVQVEVSGQNKRVQSGKGSGDAVFATETEAKNVADMFQQTLDGCSAEVVDIGNTSPPS